jgi:uncharacterized protein
MTTLDLKLSAKSEWIEMFPFGIAMGANNVRPVMIFKDKSEKRVLPVWLSPMDAGIAVAQTNAPYQTGARSIGSPHEISWQVLKEFGIDLEKCLFKRVTQNQQFVELHFTVGKSKKNHLSAQVIEARAHDAISFCLRSGCKFFATLEYIESSRVLESELGVNASLLQQNEALPRYLN